MKKFILLIILLFSQYVFAQQISLSKDSLFIISHFNGDYFGNTEFTFYDSLWIYNTGDLELIIDSIKTQRTYSYRLKVELTDSVSYYIVYNWEQHLVNFSIAAKDSAKLIFADPDLCPICKSQNDVYMFEDTLFIYSNSITNGIKEIYVTGDGTSDVEINNNNNYESFSLSQNYPNPFNPTTNINFTIAKRSRVSIIVYDILGKEIITLINEEKNPGDYSVRFDAIDFSSGVYFYVLRVNEFVETKKMILVR